MRSRLLVSQHQLCYMPRSRIVAARVVASAWLAVACGVVLTTAQPQRVALINNRVDPPLPCGTEVDRDPRTQAIAPNGLADGEPLFFDQDPPVIRPDYTGPITLRHFNVVGDYAARPSPSQQMPGPSSNLGRLPRGYRARLRLVRAGLATTSLATSMGASFSRPVASSRVNSMRQTGQR